MIAAGSVPAGTRLPTIRQLARDLAVAPGTVARAYRELEASGLVETRGRHGTFVLAPTAATGADVERRLDEAARQFALAMRQAGATTSDALARAERALIELTPAS